MIATAQRIQQVEEYYFSRKLREIRELIAQGKPIINLGIGSPDLPPDEKVRQALVEAISEPKAFSYQSYQGIPTLTESFMEFVKNEFAVGEGLECMPLQGSKKGITDISLAFLNPDEEALIPNPGYPTYAAVTRLAEGKSIYYSLSEVNNWLPSIEELEGLVTEKTKIMWINYPHMPTGASPEKDALQQVVDFCIDNHILLVNDNPYAHILTEKAFSIFQLKGAEKIGIELHSMSKTFNMAGCRIGFAVAKKELLNAITKVSTQMESGMFLPQQEAAIAVLKAPTKWIENLNMTYAKRRELVWQLCDVLGIEYTKNTGGLFVWAKLPEGKNAEEWSDEVLYKHNFFITPGTVFGSNGEGYVRFSLCQNESEFATCIQRVKEQES